MQTLGKLESIALRSLVKIVESNQLKNDKTYGKLEEVSRKYLSEIKELGEAIESTKKSIEMFSGRTYDEVVALLKGGEIAETEEFTNADDIAKVEEPIVEKQSDMGIFDTPVEVVEVIEEEQIIEANAQAQNDVIVETKAKGSEGEINFFKTN